MAFLRFIPYLNKLTFKDVNVLFFVKPSPPQKNKLILKLMNHMSVPTPSPSTCSVDLDLQTQITTRAQQVTG